MKAELKEWLDVLSHHPLVYGLSAAIARWILGDKDGGIRVLIGNVAASCLVAYAAALYMADGNEVSSVGKQAFYVIVLAFIARDLLAAIILLGKEFSERPVELASRIWKAFFDKSGKPPSSEK